MTSYQVKLVTKKVKELKKQVGLKAAIKEVARELDLSLDEIKQVINSKHP